VVPATPDALGLQSAIQTTTKVRRVVGDARFKVLLTIVAPKPNRDGEDAMQYLTDHGVPHFQASIRRIVAFQRAVLEGVTVDKVDRTNLGWRDYVQTGEELLQALRGNDRQHTQVSRHSDTQVLRYTHG
jgi:chromosome partitioning protein